MEILDYNDKLCYLKIYETDYETDEYIDNEIACLKWAGKKNISPSFLCSGRCDTGRYILMEKINGITLGQLLENYYNDNPNDRRGILFKQFMDTYSAKLYEILNKMNKRCTNWDISVNNIMYDGSRFWIIDFGQAILDYSEEETTKNILNQLIDELKIIS